jgi:uncharacterized protein (TIGR02421 family)
LSAAVERIPESLYQAVEDRIAADQRLRRSLPGGGRIHVDRQLPFLVVYRPPEDGPDPGTAKLVTGSASYIVAPSAGALRGDVLRLVRTTAGALAKVFGAVLIVELWAAPVPDEEAASAELGRPRFRLVAGRAELDSSYVARLERDLRRVAILKQRAAVEVTRGRVAPPGLRPLVTATDADSTHLVGLEVSSFFQTADHTAAYPLAQRDLKRQLTRALEQGFFVFAREQTTHRPRTYQALGRRAMVKAVWKVDEQLAEVGASLDLLMLVSPANTEAAWSAFQRSRHREPPRFLYRPLPFDPAVLKRLLFDIRIERIEDPTLAYLFEQQRLSFDRQLTLVAERETPAFVHDSVALYGDVDHELFALGSLVLERLAPGRETAGKGGWVDSKAFAKRARAELRRYRRLAPELRSSVKIRDDVSSLVVSRGDLFVGHDMRFPANRVDALIHHEVGTHVVTHFNGSQQPFRQLAGGLSGYEALQEGLAVFAEYAVGGLTRGRLRLVAGRVVAARWLLDGAEFIDVFRLLNESHGFSSRVSYMIATRVFRGGGFVKDAIYLRGLADVLAYLADGGDPILLTAGKFALEHVPIIVELQRRKILRPAVLQPRWLEAPGASDRLHRCRSGLTIEHLLEEVG